MIDREHMFEPMLEACPTFKPIWDEFCSEWEGHSEGQPLYLVLGDLARHLIQLLQSETTGQFEAIFFVVERWHCEGEHYVREAATIGLLEGIQFTAGHEGVAPKLFERWLLPESKKWWDKLHRFWAGDMSALNDS